MRGISRFSFILLVLGVVFAGAPFFGQTVTDYAVYYSGLTPPSSNADPQLVLYPTKGFKLPPPKRGAYSVVVWNNTAERGTHKYKATVRVSGPGGFQCRADALVGPLSKHDFKTVLEFEAIYHSDRSKNTNAATPGLYVAWSYMIEQVPPGEVAQDTYPGNNKWPHGESVPGFKFVVPEGVDEVRCISLVPKKYNFPQGLVVPGLKP